MRIIGRVWTACVLWWLMAAGPVVAGPENDVVAVDAAAPLADIAALPGLAVGRRILADLRDARERIRRGDPRGALRGLERLQEALRRLRIGQGDASRLPPGYRHDGELWLPVAAQRLRVRLRAPDPDPGRGPGGLVPDLPARARRVAWLPVTLTGLRVERVLALLDAGPRGRRAAGLLLDAAVRGTRVRTRLDQRALILAYFRVEAALAAPRPGNLVAENLRRAAGALDGGAENGELVQRLRTLAARFATDRKALKALAGDLRARIAAGAGGTAVGIAR